MLLYEFSFSGIGERWFTNESLERFCMEGN